MPGIINDRWCGFDLTGAENGTLSHAVKHSGSHVVETWVKLEYFLKINHPGHLWTLITLSTDMLLNN